MVIELAVRMNNHDCKCSACAERWNALRRIEMMPYSMVNDSESLRETIRSMQRIATKAVQTYDK